MPGSPSRTANCGVAEETALLEQRLQEGELDLAADQRRELSSIDVDPDARDRRLGQPGGDRLGLALGGDRRRAAS